MQFTQVPMGKQPFLAQPLTPEMLRTLEQLMDTGLVTGGLGFGVPDLSASLGGQFPAAQPGSPDQRIRQEYDSSDPHPQPQMPAPTPAPSPVRSALPD